MNILLIGHTASWLVSYWLGLGKGAPVEMQKLYCRYSMQYLVTDPCNNVSHMHTFRWVRSTSEGVAWRLSKRQASLGSVVSWRGQWMSWERMVEKGTVSKYCTKTICNFTHCVKRVVSLQGLGCTLPWPIVLDQLQKATLITDIIVHSSMSYNIYQCALIYARSLHTQCITLRLLGCS